MDQLDQADCDECFALQQKLSDLLSRTATALKGEAPEGTLHSFHDLPELAGKLKDQLQVWEAIRRSIAPALDEAQMLLQEWMHVEDPHAYEVVRAKTHKFLKWDEPDSVMRPGST